MDKSFSVNNQEENNENYVNAARGGAVAVQQINRQLKEKEIMEKAASMDLGYVNLSTVPINPDLLYILKPEVAEKALVMPFFRIGKKLRVAVFDHENEETKRVLDELKEKGYLLNINLASDDSIREALTLYKAKEYKTEKEIKNVVKEDELKAYEQEINSLVDLKQKISQMPSMEALNLLNVGAVKTGASDIHFQPEEQEVLIRFRIDGLLQSIFTLDKKVYENILNQIKFKAGMKINVNIEPQDGRYWFDLNDRKIDVRVAALPTQFGESIALRLLDSGKKLLNFEQLGFEGYNLVKIQKALKISRGLILMTGPTGSGKTTTLYSILQSYNTPERKIITLEDPIEYNLKNVTQSQINDKRGYTFASGLRSILRQDPDVIMIGEIRDLKTAEAAAQAALTGHVVFSTLHTNSALETIPRLTNIGLPEYMIAPALTAVIAQRLVRRICKNCAVLENFSGPEKSEIEEVLAEIKKVDSDVELTVPSKLPAVKGCEMCSHTGYLGQIAIIELAEIDDELKAMIIQRKDIKEIVKYARSNKMITMKEDGIIKVLQGITTLEEIRRVTNVY